MVTLLGFCWFLCDLWAELGWCQCHPYPVLPMVSPKSLHPPLQKGPYLIIKCSAIFIALLSRYSGTSLLQTSELQKPL